MQVHIFQDHVEVINPGGLVGKIGSGLKHIADICRKQETHEPQIQADCDWVRIIFFRKGTGSGKSSGRTEILNPSHLPNLLKTELGGFLFDGNGVLPVKAGEAEVLIGDGGGLFEVVDG